MFANDSASTLPPFQRRPQAMRLEGCHVRQVRGKDRIVFFYGVVHGAYGLRDADLFGKSDPYCKVSIVDPEGVEKKIIHTTRVVQNCLTPAWGECFHYRVPADREVSAVRFDIFDEDEMGEDDFLGGATVDINHLANGDVLQENVQLVGAGKHRTVGRGGTLVFSLDATISVELRVERRVVGLPRTVDPAALRDAQKQEALRQEVPRHHTTARTDDFAQAYVEPARQAPERPLAEAELAAARLLAIRDARAHNMFGLEREETLEVLRRLARVPSVDAEAPAAGVPSPARDWLHPPSVRKALPPRRPAPLLRRPESSGASGVDPDGSDIHDIRGATGLPRSVGLAAAGRWAWPPSGCSGPASPGKLLREKIVSLADI